MWYPRVPQSGSGNNSAAPPVYGAASPSGTVRGGQWHGPNANCMNAVGVDVGAAVSAVVVVVSVAVAGAVCN